MVGRALIVIKKARDDPIADYPIRFRPFDNLHLELLENKKKLKKGLPLVPLTRKKPPVATPATASSTTTIAAVVGATATTAVTKKVTKEKFTETPKPKAVEAKKKVDEKATAKSKKKVEEEPPSDVPSGGGSETDAPPSGGDDGDMVDALAAGTDGEGSQPSSEDDISKKLGEGTGSKTGSKAASEANSAAEGEGEGEGEESHAEAECEEEPEEEDEYAGLTPEEKEAKQKEEYMWRFRILKKKYKTAKIPDFNEHSDLQTMKSTYERTVKELYLDESVDSYRNYLIGGFVFTEFICTQWVGIDMKGFTKQQAMVMHKYESLLVELGERSYNRWNANLPVEVRLIGFILLQAAIFFVGKKIAEKAGNSIGELFKGVTGQPPAAAGGGSTGGGSTEAEPKQSRMKGPSLRPEDIKSMKQD